jgi:hypothetical protein
VIATDFKSRYKKSLKMPKGFSEAVTQRWKNNAMNKREKNKQPENCENRNDPDLVQAFLKKWWVESDFRAPNLPLSLRFKGSGCHYNSI